MTDAYYMRRALRLARRGEGRVSPNPLVGAVIVKGDMVIGQGYHRCYGGPHAEIEAISKAAEQLAGATVYVTLEPCSHFGKTPPCATALIERRPGRVVIGTTDPNPLVAGNGVAALQRAGIATTVGVEEEACREINAAFFKFITTGLPYITLKFAQTLDGRIASRTGHSQWISSPPSRTFAHRLRHSHDAVLVGIGTVLQDDPELTVRHIRGRNPLRIIVDSRLRLPLTAKALRDQDKARTIVVATRQAPPEKIRQLTAIGVETLLLEEDGAQHVDFSKLFRELGKRQIASVLVEGGAALVTSLLKTGTADRLVAIVAPKIIGKGIEAVGDLGKTSMDEAIPVSFQRVYRLGGDVVIDARLRNG